MTIFDLVGGLFFFFGRGFLSAHILVEFEKGKRRNASGLYANDSQII